MKKLGLLLMMFTFWINAQASQTVVSIKTERESMAIIVFGLVFVIGAFLVLFIRQNRRVHD